MFVRLVYRCFVFCKQKTAYEMRISDWSSDVCSSDLAARQGGALAVWPSRVTPGTMEDARRQGVTVARVEDGFLRSKGLGAALHPPGSVVIDRAGIYYDARSPSDMEALLASCVFTPALERRAARLRARI